MIEKLGVRQIDNWQFILIGGIVVFITLLWIELSRSDKTHRLVRVLATFAAIVSLLGLVFKPYYLRENQDDLTILFTEGSTKQDSLRQAYPTARFIEWSDTVQVEHLSSNIIVDGYGIPQYDLWKVESSRIEFIKPQLPAGIIDITYSKEVDEGKTSEITFKVNNSKDHKFVLEGLGEKYDSAIASDASSIIRLEYKLKVAGMFALTLSEFGVANELINAETIPVSVNPAKKFNILLINAFPTFESRFLKQFLDTSDHNYFIRSQISTDKYRYESRGSSISEMARITTSALKGFDVLIINAVELMALPTSQQRVIANAIENEGLGILIVAGNDELNKKLPVWASVGYKKVQNENFILSEEDELKVSTSNYRFASSTLSESAYSDNDGDLVQVNPRGLGKVVLSAFIETYELSLSGNDEAYQNLWKTLLESCLMPTGKKWSLENDFIYVHEPSRFELINDSISKVVYEGAEVALKQNMLVEDRWESLIWPTKSGWNFIDTNKGDQRRKWFYVHESDEFKSVKISERILANRRLMVNENVQKEALRENELEISLWWFYSIFIISMAYLWLQPKLR